MKSPRFEFEKVWEGFKKKFPIMKFFGLGKKILKEEKKVLSPKNFIMEIFFLKPF